MSNKNLYRRNKIIGPGGMKCPCCVPTGTKKYSKKLLNKVVRKKGLKVIKVELLNLYKINQKKT